MWYILLFNNFKVIWGETQDVSLSMNNVTIANLHVDGKVHVHSQLFLWKLLTNYTWSISRWHLFCMAAAHLNLWNQIFFYHRFLCECFPLLLMLLLPLLKESQHCKVGKEWMRSISPKTQTPQSQHTKERKQKRKKWKTKWKNAAQANKEALTLLLKKSTGPTTINKIVSEIFWERYKNPTVLRGSVTRRCKRIPMSDQSIVCNPHLPQKAPAVYNKVDLWGYCESYTSYDKTATESSVGKVSLKHTAR